MKKIYTLIVAVLACLGTNAQYYYLPFTNSPGQNPGGLNNDTEYPVGGGLVAGWTSIHAGNAATPAWSTTGTIPFTFNFNGNTVSQYKVSTSGVLTFTTAAVTVPSYTNGVIPNATIPDNSIMVWGISGNGANDNIVTKTFGTAPNRQHWVFFSSYTNYGTTCWVYWSIVFEETTNKIYIVDQRNGGCTQTVTAGIQIDQSNAISVVGSPSLNNLSTTDPTPIDNQYYEFVQGTQAANEAALTALTNQQYFVIPASTNITGTVTNLGSQAITTIDIKYEVGGTTYTDTKTGLNIGFSQSYNFTHNTPVNIPASGAYPVKVWVDLGGDANHANDTLNTEVYGLTFLPQKYVVFEEATGTWCGWCPRGAVFMDSLAVLHPTTAMLIAVHNADPMVVAAYDAGVGGLIGGYPAGIVDRKDIDVDPNTFIAEYNARINDIPPASISVNSVFDPVTRVLDVTVNALMATDLSGDYRLNAIVVEDNVTGTTTSYNQTNYYSFQSQNIALQGAGHNWQTEPNPVLAANMEYDHVARAILGGFTSQVGSLPASMSANNTYSYNFSYTIPATYDETQMHVIGWIANGVTGNILNAGRGSFTTSINENTTDAVSALVYPNPATDVITLSLNLAKSENVTVTVTDILGKVYFTENLGALANGNHKLFNNISDLPAGTYVVTVKTDSGVATQKFVK